jgi:hypothetical protein
MSLVVFVTVSSLLPFKKFLTETFDLGLQSLTFLLA